MDRRLFSCALALCLFFPLAAIKAAAAEILGYAIVQDDGSLRLNGRQIRLYGIYIPPSTPSCRVFERPITYAPCAALALDFRIGTGFVHCELKSMNADDSIVALCRAGSEDLSAYLLASGWAIALPDAPFQYFALEKIARHQSVGVWGLPLDPPRQTTLDAR